MIPKIVRRFQINPGRFAVFVKFVPCSRDIIIRLEVTRTIPLGTPFTSYSKELHVLYYSYVGQFRFSIFYFKKNMY
jgi:hypothetical protein